MDINTYAARNQVAHERILAASLLLAGAVTIPESDLDILTRIKAQDQDVHSLYQREAVAGVLESVAGHLGLYPLVEEGRAAEPPPGGGEPTQTPPPAPPDPSAGSGGGESEQEDETPAKRRKAKG